MKMIFICIREQTVNVINDEFVVGLLALKQPHSLQCVQA